MNGAHRSTGQRRMVSALKSATWLLTGAGLLTALLASLGLLALVIYVASAHPDLRIAALSGASWGVISCYLVPVLSRKRARSTGPE